MATITEKNENKHRRDSQRLFALIWVFWVLLLVLITPTVVHESIRNSISDPVLFRVRHLLQKTPPLSPHLKIIALDDKTKDFLKKPELTMEDLTLLLENIARRKPKAILIDALLGTLPLLSRDDERLSRDDESAREKLNARLRAITDAPIYTGLSIGEVDSNLRSPDLFTDDKYGIESMLEGDREAGRRFIKKSVLPRTGNITVYDPAYEGSFTKVGHLGIERYGAIIPLLNYKDKYIFPHISLYAADRIAVEDGLVINGVPVPLDENGSISVNYRPLNMYYESNNMRSLRLPLIRARQHQEETGVEPGDVVIIVYNFFTGATDFIEGTPFGDMPGGVIVSTVVDSVLQNNWLRPMDYQGLQVLIVIMGMLGSLIARKTGPVQFWGILILLGGAYFLLVNYLFSYQNILISWILPLAGLIGGGTVQYIYNRLGTEWKAIALENQYLHERALRLEEEKSKIQLAERLNLGRAVQEILLPSHKEQGFGPFRFSMSYIPAQEMSGDWIYLWGKGEGERRILLGDVVGKGPSAAIPVAVIIGILGECERLNMPMTDTLQRLNQRIIELFDRQITCSCTAIVLHEKGRAEIFNAGSPGWILKGREKSRHIPLRSSALGMTSTALFVSEEIHLKESTLLFTFTDGYMEGGRALRRLIQKIDQIDELPQLETLTTMLDEIGKDFRLEDDRSLLMVHAYGTAQKKTEPAAS